MSRMDAFLHRKGILNSSEQVQEDDLSMRIICGSDRPVIVSDIRIHRSTLFPSLYALPAASILRSIPQGRETFLEIAGYILLLFIIFMWLGATKMNQVPETRNTSILILHETFPYFAHILPISPVFYWFQPVSMVVIPSVLRSKGLHPGILSAILIAINMQFILSLLAF